MSEDSQFPTSYAQRRLWFIQQLEPTSCAYNMLISTPLPRGLDPAWVQEALDVLVDRHEVLRTSFVLHGADIAQGIAPSGRIALECHPVAEPAASDKIVSEAVSKPFDLTCAPLARARLGLLSDGSANLSLVIHHIIADGQTLTILIEDLLAALQQIAAGSTPVLAAAPIEYADYAVWQRRSLKGPRREALTDYWTQRLAGIEDLALNLDHARPATGGHRGGVVRFGIDAAVADGLRALAAQERTTLFAVLLAGFSVLLTRVSGKSAVVVGLPVSGRSKTELERVAGLFINSLPFHIEFDPAASFSEHVRITGARLVEDLSHQDMPFELLVEALRAPRRANLNPLFQVMLQLQVDKRARGGADLREPQIEADSLSSQLDLSFIMFDGGTGALEGGAVFASELFERQTIAGLVEAFTVMLAAAARDGGAKPSGRLPLLTEKARAEALALGHGPIRDWAGPATLGEAFSEQAAATPHAVAVEQGARQLTFGQLDARARSMAARLAGLGVGPGDVVAISIARSPDLVAAVVGTTMCGAAWLTLDPALPAARREFILQDSGARAVIAQADVAIAGLPRLEPGGVAAAAGAFSPAGDDSPAYVIYTSGSTGEPKGVAIPVAAIVNHMRWMIEQFGFGPDERILQRTPVTFDASVWEIWAPLMCGGTLVLQPDDAPFDPDRLLDLVRSARITTLQVVPSLLQALVDRPGASQCRALRQLFAGGEPLRAALADRALAVFGARLHNLYGPSETTIDATWTSWPQGEAPEGIVPIGWPIANVRAYVLDDQLEPVPRGATGELCIGGAAVGIGYLGRPELEGDRFVDDPHGSGRLFRTGDLAAFGSDGSLRFLGRLDDQVKLRGYRIELGEIEALLVRHASVAQAGAAIQDRGENDRRLVAFVVPAEDHTVSPAELVGWLRDRLPAYAMPGAIGVRDQLPRTRHGKLDRRALASLPLDDVPARSAPTGRRSPELEAACEAFAEALGASDFDADDDFFERGGHSLLAVKLQALLVKALGRDLTLVDLFEHPSPRRLVEALFPGAHDTQSSMRAVTGTERITP